MRVYDLIPDEIPSSLSTYKSSYQHFNNLNEDVEQITNRKKERSIKERSKKMFSKKFPASLPTLSNSIKPLKGLYEIVEVPEHEELSNSCSILEDNLHGRLSSQEHEVDSFTETGANHTSHQSTVRLLRNNISCTSPAPYCVCSDRKCNKCQKSAQIRRNYSANRKRRLLAEGKDFSYFGEMEVVEEEKDEEQSKKFMVTLTAKDSFMDTLMKWTVLALLCVSLSPVSVEI
jgi:hypothetical protein